MIPLLLALWLGPQDKPPEKCSLSGTVVDSVSGEPLAKVEITLIRTADNYHPSGTTSIEQGRFALRDIEPGDYRLTGERGGYLETAYGARNSESDGAVLHLDAGQNLTDIALKLIPAGVIAGTIRDSDGEPVEGAHLTIASRTYGSGGPVVRAFDSADTDDLGQYRFHKLPPGKYYVSAAKQTADWNRAVYSPPPGPIYESILTFYPGVGDIVSATAVEVAVGAHVTDVDFKLLRSRVFRVSGKVTSSQSMPGELMLLPPTATEQASESHLATFVSATTGDFVFDRVPPGSYTLQARGSVPALMPLEVGQKDVEGIRLLAGASGGVKGRITVEGEGKFLPNGSVFITADGRLGNRTIIQQDGTFRQEKLAPGKYRLQIFSNQMRHFYVKSIRVGGVETQEEKVDVAAGAATEVELLLGADGGSVSGTVHSKDGDLVSSATVVLIPDGALRGRTDLYRVASSDQFGSFRMENVAPGSYNAFAWDEIEPDKWFDQEFMSQYSKFALAWEVKPGATSSLGLNLAHSAR